MMFAIVQSETWGIGDVRVIGLFLVGLALVPYLLTGAASIPNR